MNRKQKDSDMTNNHQHPASKLYRTGDEALAAMLSGKAEASRKAKRGWDTRRRNARSIDRMIAAAVARDTR